MYTKAYDYGKGNFFPKAFLSIENGNVADRGKTQSL